MRVSTCKSAARLGAALWAISLSAPARGSVVPDDYPTVQAALDAAAPGETILVKDTPGPYYEKIVFPASGLPGSPITLAAFPGHRPVLDGTGVAGADMVLVPSRSSVRLIGFEIRNNTGVTDGSGVRIVGSGSHIEIRDNLIHDIRGRNAMGITVYGTEPTPISDLVIDGNEIFDCEPAPSEALTLNGNVERFEVTNNAVHDVNNIGIDFIGGERDIQPDPQRVARDGVCRGNRVYRARSRYGGGFAAGIYVDGGRNIAVENNSVSECDLGIEVGAENQGIVATGIAVRDNLVFRNDKAGIAFGGYAASAGRVRDSLFQNNTLYDNDALGLGYGELWIQWADGNSVRNNIFAKESGRRLLLVEPGAGDNALDFNLWHAPGGAGAAVFAWRGTEYAGFDAYRAASGTDAHSLFADPQLVAPPADLHLRSDSPARDAGDPAFVPATGEADIDGAPRVAGPRVDAGADEITCGNGVLDPGETCDDGNLADCDGCDSNCTPTGTCGNHIACPPEQCDDGNQSAGDCCSPSCAFEPAGSACDDGDLCTAQDRCDGSGSCAGVADPEPACRLPAAAGASVLLARDRADDARDALAWRWSKGAATEASAFGDPTAATRYALCVFDASAAPQPVVRAELPAGGLWRAVRSGFRYRNRTGSAAGVRELRLQAGAEGEARIRLAARGAHLVLPPSWALPVVVQLKNDAGECWGATYSEALRNEPGRLRARSD